MAKYSLGFDFGTESLRVVIVNIKDGAVAGESIERYAHGVIDRALPASGEKLPADYALQHPQDWIDSLTKACQQSLASSRIQPTDVIGIGIDFTSCTMLPCKSNGTPLCLLDEFKNVPLAYPKLWKHHGANAEAQRINDIARQRNESWLARYGGAISVEWFFPKILETLNHAPEIYHGADLFIEAGDWIAWQLATGPFPHCDVNQLVRSTCQAGYKAMWNAKHGYPSTDYFASIHPLLTNVAHEKLPGVMRSPGLQVGVLTARAAKLLHLREDIPISTAIIDAHAGVPGAGVASPSTMVMVLGTSSCHMLNSRIEQLAPGIAGVVEDGILPGYFGYETGQAAVGDALAWLVQTVNRSHEDLSRNAAKLPPGANGVFAIEWFNGCRSPLMDPNLTGAFIGLTLSTTPAQLYRALIESTAFGLRWIIETLRNAGVPVRRFVASGGLPAKSPLLMQIYADVLAEKITLAASAQPCAQGAAILGCLAAGSNVTGYSHVSQAIHAMAQQRDDLIYRPDLRARKQYNELYNLYRQLTNPSGEVASIMPRMRVT